jgi:hypothetical protein
MPDSMIGDMLRVQTADVIEASLEMCCSSRGHLIRSASVVRLSRETIASSILLLSRVKQSTSAGYL